MPRARPGQSSASCAAASCPLPGSSARSVASEWWSQCSSEGWRNSSTYFINLEVLIARRLPAATPSCPVGAATGYGTTETRTVYRTALVRATPTAYRSTRDAKGPKLLFYIINILNIYTVPHKRAISTVALERGDGDGGGGGGLGGCGDGCGRAAAAAAAMWSWRAGSARAEATTLQGRRRGWRRRIRRPTQAQRRSHTRCLRRSRPRARQRCRAYELLAIVCLERVDITGPGPRLTIEAVIVHPRERAIWPSQVNLVPPWGFRRREAASAPAWLRFGLGLGLGLQRGYRLQCGRVPPLGGEKIGMN